MEPGENPRETVRREAREKLGIDAEFTVTKTVGTVARHTGVSLCYFLKGDPNRALNYDLEEFYQICWFAIDEIPFQKLDPDIVRFIQKMFGIKQWVCI